MWCMKTPPTPERIRLTITVDPEVHEAFQHMAQASSMSIGRCMGEWLADTVDGARFVTAQLVRAREAPRQVVKEIRQMALGSVDLADDVLADLRAGKKPALVPERASARAARPERAPASPSTPLPPRSVIRGGKSLKTTPRDPG